MLAEGFFLIKATATYPHLHIELSLQKGNGGSNISPSEVTFLHA